ncbi:universal stress protein [Pontibacter rugosus]|uniref:Universal stress protein n=1 Tax=Pontibacter rugosus TaxID=1745966 RepID=A0ABW3SPL8_9BACT
MKNILVSVDFSKNAADVALYTAEMAMLCKARLILFYAYHPAATDSSSSTFPSERQVQARLDKLARKLHNSTGASITRLIKPGSETHEILAIADTVKASIAILCHPNIEGQCALTVSAHNTTPVLSIPTTAPFDMQALQSALAQQLQLPGFLPAPILAST